MAKISTQTINGKAFEYALLNEFLERLKIITSVSVIENEPFKTALTRMALHASYLSFIQPFSNQLIEILSEPAF